MGYYKAILVRPESDEQAIVMSLEHWRTTLGFCESGRFPAGFSGSDFHGETCACCVRFVRHTEVCHPCPLDTDGGSLVDNMDCAGGVWRDFRAAYPRDFPAMTLAASEIVRQLEAALAKIQAMKSENIEPPVNG